MREDEWELLQRYARAGEQSAFAELAGRYVEFVYGSCLRQLRDAHLAEDVTQGVFLVLATKGKGLARETILSGWLFQVARYACGNAIKMRSRRARHESAAARAGIVGGESKGHAMDELRLLLDDAVGRLRQADRHAVLLRYFEDRSVQEVAAALGISENAATKRLSRAIGKLRAMFAQSGVVLLTMAAGDAIAAASRADTPSVVRTAAGLVARHSGAAPAAITIAKATMKTMRWAAIKSAVAVVAAAMIIVGCGGVRAHQALSGRSASAAPAIASASQPSPAPGTLFVRSGEGTKDAMYLCHWEAAAEPGLAQAIESLGRLVPTDSEGYRAFTCDGETLVSAIRAGKSDKTLLGLGGGLEFPLSSGDAPWTLRTSPAHTASDLTVEPDAHNPHASPIYCASNGKVTMDVRDSYIHLKVSVDDARVTVAPGGRPVLAGTMHFKGNIQPGQAVVFLGDFRQANGGDAVDVVVWQAFSTRYSKNLEITMDPAYGGNAYDALRKWIDQGSKAILAGFVADTAWNWQAPAAEDQRDPRWIRTLADGTVVKLLAVSRPYAHPLRWWDPDGARVASPLPNQLKPSAFSLPDDQRTLALLITGPSASAITGASGYDDATIDRPDPNGATFTVAGTAFPAPPADHPTTEPSPRLVRFAVPATGDHPIHVGLRFGTGAWTNVAALKNGNVVHAGGCDYTLREVNIVRPRTADDPGQTAIAISYTDSPDRQTTFALVRKDGTEVLLPPLPQQVTQMSETQPAMRDYYQSGPVGSDDIDRVEVKTRPVERIAFDGISANPKGPPPTELPPPVRLAGSPGRAVPSAHPGAGSPEAAMADFAAAVRAGDRKLLDAAFYAPAPADRARADTSARLAIAASKLLAAAEAKFGAEEADRTLSDDWAIQYWAEIGEIHWVIEGGQASPSVYLHEFNAPLFRHTNRGWKIDCSKSAVTFQSDELESKIHQLETLTAATSAGKYDSAFDLRDDLIVPPDLGAKPAPITQPW